MSEPRDELGTPASRWRHGCRKIRESADWVDFVGPDWVKTIMDVEVKDRFHAKQGRSIGRWTLTAPDGRTLVVYLKRHYILPRSHGLLSVLFPRKARSPGLEEYEHLAWAAAQGIPVPRPVAAGEILLPGGRLQSFLALEELTNMVPLHEGVPQAAEQLPAPEFQRWKDSLSSELVRLSHEFHDRSTFHRDWYFCHFYIDEADTKQVPENWRGRVTVIDLHRMIHQSFAIRTRAKDLAQLLYSSDVPGVTDEDRQGFWKAYRKGVWFSGLLAWFVRMKWRLYRRHNAPKG
ncbi:lipopolysaccharide kinase InaA family protein [Zavarzinella formosa]|uniref:lipopolysaccharide kinase InaA family protein n=1 Tax=Zavarzinella formosa TaxID=360055 RepID=UPI0002DF8B8E|nr:lipopolysaccharide kinase InaA family protein [Zavarzinella formosa]